MVNIFYTMITQTILLTLRGNYLLGSKIGNWEVFDLEGNFQNYFE